MGNKTKILFKLYFLFLILFIGVSAYLNVNEKRDQNYENKINNFVSIVSLPDLAISTEAMAIRHRSLADTFSLFKESPELNEYFPTTFTYNHSTLHKVNK